MTAGRDAERRVRRMLQEEFRQPFSEAKLKFGTTLNGTRAAKRFDAVSEDQQIVAMVKDYSATNMQGNRTRLARVSHDLLLLHSVDAKRRFMFLSKPFYDWFRDTPDAVVPDDVCVRTLQ